MSPDTVARFERGEPPRERTIDALRAALEAPGTGLYWTETYPVPAQAPHAGHRLALIVVLLALVAAAVFALAILAPG